MIMGPRKHRSQMLRQRVMKAMITALTARRSTQQVSQASRTLTKGMTMKRSTTMVQATRTMTVMLMMK